MTNTEKENTDVKVNEEEEKKETENSDSKKVDAPEAAEKETPAEAETKEENVKEETKEEAKEEVKEETNEEQESELIQRFTVEVSRETFEARMEEALVKYAGEIKMPGFRKGKVPMEVVKSRLQEPIKEEVVNKVMEEAVFEKIEKDGIKIAGPPKIEKLEDEEGKDLKAEVAVEIMPNIELPDLESLEIEIPADQIKYEEYSEEKQIDAVLEGNRRQAPVINREIKDGDHVMLKYQSKILQTKRMTPKKSSNFVVDEKEKFEILDLYKEIIGKKIDDTITIQRTYPEDYQKKAWAGKDLEHYITVESVFEMVKPELNEVFLKSIGFQDEETFKTKLKEEYEEYNQKQVEDKKLKFIMDKLEDAVSFTVPQGLVEQETMRVLSQYKDQLKGAGTDQLKGYFDFMKKDTEKKIRSSLILEKVKENFDIEVSGDELEAEYKKIAEKNQIPLKEVRKHYMNKQNSQQMKDHLVHEKLMGLIKEKVKIKEV